MREVIFEPELAERLGKQYRMEKPPANLTKLIEHVNAQVRASPGGAVWGQPLGPDRIFSFMVDAGNGLTMTVNGQPSTSFDLLVFEDDQAIAIVYGPR